MKVDIERPTVTGTIYLWLQVNVEYEQLNPENRHVVFVLSIFTLITLYSPIILLLSICVYGSGDEENVDSVAAEVENQKSTSDMVFVMI
ncbi:hypothetical protein L2E82_00559 [Cichorium intybus]|uniref:Uncharacterized protein n=1 Tax=Cichorium intybus TaxID=13427 RepID=A0ACB9GY42_CICIN|nr:hypothetical protein L2E82_00559 [Cichorium intybus]